jgi:hypothetical protein
MLFPLTVPFFLGGPPPTEDENGCWIGLPTEFEIKLLQPMATYALEQLRQRFMYTLTYDHNQVKSARVIFQMGFETEIGAALRRLINLPAEILSSKVCGRRRFLEIDQDMALQRYLIGPALEELAQVPDVPVIYVDLFRRYLLSEYPRYRMCALAAAICMAKALQ